MYKIIIAEDEPASASYLCSIIEQKCEEFEVISVAEDGNVAFDAIIEKRPDILITDIRMPLLNGIELVTQLKEANINVISIIVSGYQDFEYAKGAIKLGVMDYLLKPVNIAQLKQVMDKIKEKLDKEYETSRVDLLKRLCFDTSVDKELLRKYLPFNQLVFALVRKNGLPSRFFSKSMLSDKQEGNAFFDLSNINKHANTWQFYGRDENELIIIMATSDKNSMKDVIDEKAKLWVDNGYYTAIIHGRNQQLSSLSTATKDAFEAMNKNLIIGLDQKIIILQNEQKQGFKAESLDSMVLNKLEYLITNGLFEELKTEFIKNLNLWEQDHQPQLRVESNIRAILARISKLIPQKEDGKQLNLEMAIDEIMFFSTSMGEVMSGVWELIETILQKPSKDYTKQNIKDFLCLIDDYLMQNISEAISLQNICSIFGISQTYLSRLFRRYKSLSFNEYLTKIRVEKSIMLMKENPNVLLKDIASMVGYNDSSYFSKVFRSYTGLPPSEFLTKCDMNK